MRSIVTVTTPRAFDELGGLMLWQRVIRTLGHLGSESVQLIIGPAVSEVGLKESVWQESYLDDGDIQAVAGKSLTSVDLLEMAGEGEGPILVVPGESVFDPRILEFCLNQTAPVACVDRDPPAEWRALVENAPRVGDARFCGPVVVTDEWLNRYPGDFPDAVAKTIAHGSLPTVDVDSLPTRAGNLRRDVRPFWFPAPDSKDRSLARRLLLSSTQKGSLDLPAMVHAPIEKLVAWSLAGTKITPNMVTVLTTLVAWVATVMFIRGHLVTGLVLALMVGVLDGVDGKLARLRFEFSRFGELEHWLDFLYEWSWWVALAYYFSSSGLLPQAWRVLGLLAFFEVVDGLAKAISIVSFGRLIDEISPFERMVRIFGGRRNVYIWLMVLGTVLGKPAAAFEILPIWQGATAILHWIRLPWLFANSRKEQRIGGITG
jgi:phosphatidylglycerophosphate synthase